MTGSICNKCNEKCMRKSCVTNHPLLIGPNDGFIYVLNDAGFFIRYSGSYMNSGRVFTFSTNAYPVGWDWKVNIPANSTDIKLKVEYLAGDFYWYTLFSTTFNKTDVYCYQTYGTIWNPKIHKITCESPHLM